MGRNTANRGKPPTDNPVAAGAPSGLILTFHGDKAENSTTTQCHPWKSVSALVTTGHRTGLAAGSKQCRLVTFP